MIKNKVAVIDCDQTVVDSAYAWYLWLEDKTKAGYPYDLVKHVYDFSQTYTDVWIDKCIDGHPYDFWRARDVYDNLQPLEGCVEVLKTIQGWGYHIVFVSAVKGDHHKSKYNFLNRHFPFMDGFIATQEKGFVKADLVIDDRNKFLNMFDEDVLKFKRLTPFDQDEELKVKIDYEFTDWKLLF